MVNMTQREMYQWLRQQLMAAGIEEAKVEAGFLLEHILKKSLPQILMNGSDLVADFVIRQAEQYCKKRAEHYPLQYLLGIWEFYGLTLQVGEGVLIPRQDTETLVEAALQCCRQKKEICLLDLCSGSGCIPAAIATQTNVVHGMAVEREDAAFFYLQQNLHKYAPQIHPVQADVLHTVLSETISGYTVITCNPPYLTETDMRQLQPEVAFEPETALFGGQDGLYFYREITKRWKSVLEDGGWLLYEIGMGQETDVKQILAENGLTEIFQQQDAAGIVRVVGGKRKKR